MNWRSIFPTIPARTPGIALYAVPELLRPSIAHRTLRMTGLSDLVHSAAGT